VGLALGSTVSARSENGYELEAEDAGALARIVRALSRPGRAELD
jgi:hypothetical protein